MLRVPTYVAPSPIAGVGLFAATDLPAKSLVWEFSEGVDWRISSSELLLFPEPFQERLRHYLYLDDSGLYVLCGDNAKYMNHSDHPNCDDSGSEYTVACRTSRLGKSSRATTGSSTARHGRRASASRVAPKVGACRSACAGRAPVTLDFGEWPVWAGALLIFCSRVTDVTLGTLRISFISRGEKSLAPIIAFFEMLV